MKRILLLFCSAGWLLSSVACGSKQEIESGDLNRVVSFENATDSEIVVRMQGKSLSLAENSIGFLPERGKKSSLTVTVFRKTDGLWQTDLEAQIRVDQSSRDRYRLSVSESGRLELTAMQDVPDVPR